MEPFSYANLSFLEDLYKTYFESPDQLEESWRHFFAGMEFAGGAASASQDLRVFQLITAYRLFGHKEADINPLQKPLQERSDLSIEQWGFSQEDLPREFPTFGLLTKEKAPLHQIVATLKQLYCKAIGYEFMYAKEEIKTWLLQKIEKQPPLCSTPMFLEAFELILRAELFEQFIHTRYPGQTRFSLEGAETMLPLLSLLVNKASKEGIEEIFIGMTHRGRLNVLAHILHKSYAHILSEFEDIAELNGSGDVKYHKGAHTTLPIDGKGIGVSLASNPSHLESIDPVVEGQVRAKQELKGGDDRLVLPLLIHGDASLAGQGVVYETLQMSSLQGYQTGGTIHLVINNHIGYTTLPKEGRSTFYCTDLAKTFSFPVFHVHAEKPAECLQVALLAIELRQKFQCDVVIDLGCYRKYGHNEGDEPMFTQPLEYQMIQRRDSARLLFQEELIKLGLLTHEIAKNMESSIRQELAEAAASAASLSKGSVKELQKQQTNSLTPSCSLEKLQDLTEKITSIPQGMQLHPKLQKILQERKQTALHPDKPLVDWGMAEQLAFACLLDEKIHVRLSGQDVARGTFSHRHATWVDQTTGSSYTPLAHLHPKQAPFCVYNSPLSEFAVLGFDLGYSLSYPKSLVLWEAQFGDFVNGAQVIIDQYLSTFEQKWSHLANLTLLLPHGYEGKGPEHSSARIERFLQLSSQSNWTVANCTTPAQFFFLLRRQAHLTFKKPLILFTPKLLLRHPSCLSSLSELTTGIFQPCLRDESAPPSSERVFLCSGKVFYDLVQERKLRDKKDPILRLEQLYPFPKEELLQLLKTYKQLKELVFVQEEPQNMGAWSYVQTQLQQEHFTLRYAGRKESASPAIGSYNLHKQQLKQFMQEAFS